MASLGDKDGAGVYQGWLNSMPHARFTLKIIWQRFDRAQQTSREKESRHWYRSLLSRTCCRRSCGFCMTAPP